MLLKEPIYFYKVFVYTILYLQTYLHPLKLLNQILDIFRDVVLKKHL